LISSYANHSTPQQIMATHSNLHDAHLYFFAFEIESEKMQTGFKQFAGIGDDVL
jgi:hypothetical protein